MKETQKINNIYKSKIFASLIGIYIFFNVSDAVSNDVNQSQNSLISAVYGTVNMLAENIFALQIEKRSRNLAKNLLQNNDNTTDKNNIWVKTSKLSDDYSAKNIAYSSNNKGVMLGYDRQLTDKIIAGIAFTIADSEVDSGENMANLAMINNYGVMLYMVKQMGNWYLNNFVSYIKHDITAKRSIAANDKIATSKQSSRQYIISSEAGYPLYIKNSNWIFTPYVAAKYSFLQQDDYLEENAGFDNLTVKMSGQEKLATTIGMNINYAVEKEKVIIKPGLNLRWRHNLLDTQTSALSYDANLYYLSEAENYNQDLLSAGVDLQIKNFKGLSFSAGYDYDISADYSSHTAYFKAKKSF